MSYRIPYKNRIFISVLVIGFLVAALIVLNNWVMGQVNQLNSINKPAVTAVALPEAPVEIPAGTELTRRAIFHPSREFSINIVYADGKEVAQFKSQGTKIYDIEGEIPDGKIKFVDESNDTYGEEFFKDNLRHGPYREFYSNGQIKKEIDYGYGTINTVKEYFFDGKPRMEADYKDALVFVNEKESGKGKVYYRSGVMMYEWNLTNFDNNRYKKSYNVNGELVETKKFDSKGTLVETLTYPPRG